MRSGFGLTAGLIVLGGIAASLPAQTSRTNKVMVAPKSDVTAALTARPNAAAQSTVVGVAYFSGQECQDLGGVINLDTAGICSSGQMCKRVDNQGVEHRMCITVGQ